MKTHTTRRRWVSAAIVAIAVAGAFTTAAISRANADAQHSRFLGPRTMGYAGSGRMMLAQMAQQLDLSDAQKHQIRSLLASERPRAMPLVRELIESHRAMQSVTASGQFNDPQVRAVAENQAEALTDLLVEMQRVKAEINGVLTPEQQQKLAQLIDTRRSQMMQRFLQPFAAPSAP